MAGLLAGGLTFLVVPVGPALADHDHGRGAGHQAERPAVGPRADEAARDLPAGGGPGGATGSSTPVTEDTDANDGGTPNNVVDTGDDQHPSGRDRSVEPGGSGNQGSSPSDPDAGENGGADKPGGPGGDDLADQDGNNGCGNDDDFEDDNNGNCGGRRPVPAGGGGGEPVGGEPVGGGQPAVAGTAFVLASAAPEVLGVSFEREAPAAAAVAAPAAPAPPVLGAGYERAALAATGAELDLLAFGGLGLVAMGAAARRVGRRR